MAWVSKDVVTRTLASGKVATHTYYRAKDRGPDRRIRLLGSFRRKAEAYAFLERVAREQRSPDRPVPVNGLTLAELVTRFLVDRFPEWDPEGTELPAKPHFRNSKQVLDRFAACVGGALPASALTREHVRAFTGALRRDDLAPASVHSYLAYVSRLLNWAHERRLIPEPIRVERRDPKVTRPALSDDEVAAIFEQAREYPARERRSKDGNLQVERGRLVPILACLYFAGLRRGELVTLTWADVLLDVPHPAILIRHKPAVRQFRERLAVVDGRRRRTVEEVVAPWAPKHGTVRAVPILAPLARILREARPRRPDPAGFVFTTSEGRPFSVWGLSTLLRRFGRSRLGRSLGTHVFRRSFATALAARGTGAHALQQALGHASIETTSRYVDLALPLAHIAPDALPDPTRPAIRPLPGPPECAEDEVIGLAERSPRYDRRTARRLVRQQRGKREAEGQLMLWEPAEA